MPGLAVALLWGTAALGAPDDGRDPARARVAAQCAAFWEGAGEAGRAAAFRQLAGVLGLERSEAERFVRRLGPAMEQLAADRANSDRAAALWERHARLCGG